MTARVRTPEDLFRHDTAAFLKELKLRYRSLVWRIQDKEKAIVESAIGPFILRIRCSSEWCVDVSLEGRVMAHARHALDLGDAMYQVRNELYRFLGKLGAYIASSISPQKLTVKDADWISADLREDLGPELMGLDPQSLF